MGDLLESQQGWSYGGSKLVKTDVANPCGLIAKYYFSDSYALTETGTNTAIPINEKGIAHNVDIDYKFKKPDDADDIQWLDVTNGNNPLFLISLSHRALHGVEPNGDLPYFY